MSKLTFFTLFVIFLFFYPVFADEITDFKIEGISVGDSALDHFTISQINKQKEDIYCNISNKNNCSDFYSATFFDSEKFIMYDAVRIHSKNKDKKNIIYSITGHKYFSNNLQKCLNQKNIILKDVSSSIQNLTKTYDGTFKHGADKSGKSKVTTTDYEFPNGDRFFVSCIKWSKKFDHPVTLNVNFEKMEFSRWVTNLYR